MVQIIKAVLAKVNKKKDELFMRNFLQTKNVMYYIQRYYGFWRQKYCCNL